jgi:hypothetical protein
MVMQSAFPRTDNRIFNDPSEYTSGIGISQSFKIYQPSYIPSREVIPSPNKTFGKQKSDELIEARQKSSSIQLVEVSRKEALHRDYTKSSMLWVDPSDIKRKMAILLSPTILVTSPIHPLQFLETGWDGYWAAPLSQDVLVRASQLWSQIERIAVGQSDLPTIRPAANGLVAFTWSHEYPEKELEIWLYDQPDYYAEWMLSVEDEDEENTAQSQAELLKVIKRYQEL